jgi:hypothetical protein
MIHWCIFFKYFFREQWAEENMPGGLTGHGTLGSIFFLEQRTQKDMPGGLRGYGTLGSIFF